MNILIFDVETISGLCSGLEAKPPDAELSEEIGKKFAEVRPQGHHLHGDRGGHPRGQPPLCRNTTCEPSLAGHADWCTVNVAGPSHRRLPPDVCGKPLLHGGGHQGKGDDQIMATSQPIILTPFWASASVNHTSWHGFQIHVSNILSAFALSQKRID